MVLKIKGIKIKLQIIIESHFFKKTAPFFIIINININKISFEC